MSAWRCLHLRAIITRPHDFKVIFQPLEYSSASQRHRAHFSHDSHRPVHPKLGMSTHLFIPTPKRRTGAISTDINDNCRRNGSPDRVNRLRTAAGRVGSTPIKLNNMTTMTTASFPLLDDVTAGLVASFLPVKDLGLSALINKAWLELNANESLWRPFLSTVDLLSPLGETRVRELSSYFSSKQVVSELSTRRCAFCKTPTNGFFALTCTRVCLTCFRSDERVQMCSHSYARSQYLLRPEQVDMLPSIYVEDAKECTPFSNGQGLTITTCSAAKASAVARWGSETAFNAALAREGTSARYTPSAPHLPLDSLVEEEETTKKAQMAVGGVASSPPPFSLRSANTFTTPEAGVSTGRSTLRKFYRTRSRTLQTPEREVNHVGMNQQRLHSVHGEKYGFFTVVNEAFFENGPTIVISETGATTSNSPAIADMETSGSVEMDLSTNNHKHSSKILQLFGRSAHQRGRKLIKAISASEAGTTIKIEAPVVLDTELHISTSIKLVGENRVLIEMASRPLEISAPSVVQNLSIAYLPDEREAFEQEGFPDNLVGPAVIVMNDALVENCRFGPCPAGQAVMLQLGRLMIRGCTFSEVVYGVVVVPWEDTAHLATTVHLESNCFNTCDIWGLMKGPERCHPQKNSAVLKANKFIGFGFMHEAISDEH